MFESIMRLTSFDKGTPKQHTSHRNMVEGDEGFQGYYNVPKGGITKRKLRPCSPIYPARFTARRCTYLLLSTGTVQLLRRM